MQTPAARTPAGTGADGSRSTGTTRRDAAQGRSETDGGLLDGRGLRTRRGARSDHLVQRDSYTYIIMTFLKTASIANIELYL